MGVNCCSHEKEAPEITIYSPEKNIISSDLLQNSDQIIKSEIKEIKEGTANTNINNNFQMSSPVDFNSLNYNSNQDQVNTLTISQKDIDDIINQALQNNNDINNEIIIQNGNTQNKTEAPLEQEIDKYLKGINIQNNNDINQYNNMNINVEEILKKQSQQSNTDYEIEEILKNTTKNNNINNNGNNLDLNAFFNQNNDNNNNNKIDDDFINKLFENNNNNFNNNINEKNPLFYSQQIQSNNQLKIDNDNFNRYYSPDKRGKSIDLRNQNNHIFDYS